MKKSFAILAAVLLNMAVFVAIGVTPATVSATPDYSNSDMIDDAVFNNLNTMNYVQVYNFLNGSDHRLAGPSTCLSADNYTFPNWHYDGTNFYYGDGGNWNNAWGASMVPAASIIYTSAQMWGINPEVILATLQKEEGLVYGPGAYGCSSATNTDFQSAMGYTCVEGGSCDPTKAGFTKQVLWGSWQLEFNMQRSEGNLGWLGNQDISYVGYWSNGSYQQLPYQRCATCAALPGAYGTPSTIDGQSVVISNGATASLYSYTPHLGQSFPVWFEDWFGSTLTGCSGDEQVLPQVQVLYNPRTYEHFYTAYQCEVNELSLKLGFQDEGAAFNTTSSTLAGATPVYRLYNPHTGAHLWTSSGDEITFAVRQLGFDIDGLAFWVAPTSASNIFPVYRLYNPSTYQHLWTMSMDGANAAVQHSGYIFEGPSFYSQ